MNRIHSEYPGLSHLSSSPISPHTIYQYTLRKQYNIVVWENALLWILLRQNAFFVFVLNIYPFLLE